MCWFPKTTLKFKSKSQTLVSPALPNKPIFLTGIKGPNADIWPLKFIKFQHLPHKTKRYFTICTKPIFFRQESFSSPQSWEDFLSSSQQAKTLTIVVSHKADTRTFGKCINKLFQKSKTKKDPQKASNRSFQPWCKNNLVGDRRFKKFLNVLGLPVSNRL